MESHKVQCKCRIVQVLSSSEMCDKCGLKTKETSWPDTGCRSYLIHKSLNMLLLLQGKSGTELGGAAVPCNFDRRML
jgi:altronate dehydratase